MESRTLPLLGAAALGFAAAVLCFTAWSPRPANAQFNQQRTIAQPLGQINVGQNAQPATGPQPIEIQAMDDRHFVVANREPRFVQQIGREGSAQNMLLTVVAYYEVRGDRLVSMEHVRVPPGFRLVELDN